MNEVTTNKVTAVIERKQRAYINRYNKVIEKVNRTAWELAKVVYDTINAEDFKEVFGTQREYSKMLNVSDSAITKLAKLMKDELFL